MHTMAVGGPAAKPSLAVSAASLIHRVFAGRICSKVRMPVLGEEGSIWSCYILCCSLWYTLFSPDQTQ